MNQLFYKNQSTIDHPTFTPESMERHTPSLFDASIFFFFLCFCIFLSRKWIRRHRISFKLPPSPPSLPIIGHLHLLTDMPHHSFAKLSQKLGPIIHLQLGQVTTIVVSSARLAKLVLKTYDHVFANRPQLLSAEYLSFGCSDVTFSPYGPYWRQLRKIYVTELLSTQRVKSFQLIRAEEISRMLKSLLAESGREVDMSRLFFSLANDVLCRVAFGRRFMEERPGGERRKGDLEEVLSETQALFAGFCLGDFFPEWEWVNWVTGYRRRLERNLEDLRAVCDEIIDQHVKKERSSNGDGGREDVVDVLLRVQQRDDLEVPITDDNLKAVVLDMFVAGTDTTAATLEWAMTELARHPRVMMKAQQESRKMASTSDEDHLQHLHYIRDVIKETMRLHPPVPLLVPRESIEKCRLDVYEIPAKSRILINSYAIGRDPELWENPLEFLPERFETEAKDQDFKFLPFGGGRRGCPGFSFALATLETALARLLYHFDWELPEGVLGDDVDLSEIFGLATRKKSALILVPTLNNNYQFKDWTWE